MKVHQATFLASAISGVSLIVCLLAILMIYTDVQKTWNQLDFEIITFRATTDDLWNDMIELARKKRFRRQYDDRNENDNGIRNDSATISYQSETTTTATATNGYENEAWFDQYGSETINDPSGNNECRIDNKCPAGPPGPKGPPGHK
ncbi:nematode cuticle collagen domain protein, partial [Onchocerca flexuosa]